MFAGIDSMRILFVSAPSRAYNKGKTPKSAYMTNFEPANYMPCYMPNLMNILLVCLLYTYLVLMLHIPLELHTWPILKGLLMKAGI